MSDVDKFAYLHGHLEGPAKATIAGLSLTGANYKCDVDLLKKQFEKKNEVQRAHINELIHLPSVYRERDTHRLRKLYDSCEAHNRALRALGVSEESYSTIVVPTIMEKLPEQFRLAITRGTNFLEWSMKEMLEAYEKELELREAHYPVGFNNTVKDLERNSGKKYGHQGFSAALLASEKKNCAFCLKNHAHEKCEGVVDPKIHKNIARKYCRCFLCLFKGHRASNCSVKAKCKNCNSSHHIALCEASLKDDKTHAGKKTETDNESKQVDTNVHVGTGSLVALQTARGVLRSHRKVKVRVLFDGGSHRSFVTSKAASLASPKGLRRELLGINTLGQKCTNAEQREVVALNLEPVNGKKVFDLRSCCSSRNL